MIRDFMRRLAGVTAIAVLSMAVTVFGFGKMTAVGKKAEIGRAHV